MKKLLSITALLTLLGFAPFSVASAFAASPTVTPVQYYNQAVASWNAIPNAQCYNVYYGKVTRKNTPAWNHSVTRIPKNMLSYTIKYLKQGVSYEYTVAALTN